MNGFILVFGMVLVLAVERRLVADCAAVGGPARSRQSRPVAGCPFAAVRPLRCRAPPPAAGSPRPWPGARPQLAAPARGRRQSRGRVSARSRRPSRGRVPSLQPTAQHHDWIRLRKRSRCPTLHLRQRSPYPTAARMRHGEKRACCTFAQPWSDFIGKI